MKKLALLSLVVVVAACTGDADPNDVGDGPEPISIQVFGEPEETAVYETLIDQYREETPGAEVELIEIAERDDHLARLATLFAGGDPPDIFLINYREYSQFVVRDAIEPIEDLLTERGVDLADYFPQPREAFTFDGALQCMPQNVSSLAVYYNTRLFRRAGI
ncbi:MAG: extracellular solute-binding protein, partial [Actinomycetota bacterium]|nr:extracellular solute-binding protein [Actinomycetota bacterium]